MKIYQNSSEPIYKQISSQLREQILIGKLKDGEVLPSIRGLAHDLKISVITTMKAYDELAEEGLVISAKGKGYFVNSQNKELIREQHIRQLEQQLNKAIYFARIAGFELVEVCDIFENLWEIE